MKCALCDFEYTSLETAVDHLKEEHPAIWAVVNDDDVNERQRRATLAETLGAAFKAHEPTLGHPYRMADLEPLSDRLLVRPLAVSSRSLGGLHMPEDSIEREKPQHGVVLKVGAGRVTLSAGVLLPMTVREGDCIFYGKYSGQEFTIAGERVLNMSEAEVFSRLPAGAFQVVQHEKARDWHLVGDYCDQCASPEEKAAKEALAIERERLVASRLQTPPAALALAPDNAARIADARARELQEEYDRVLPAPGTPSAIEQERERLRAKRQADDAAVTMRATEV